MKKQRADKNEATVPEHPPVESYTLSFGRYLKAIREQQGIPLRAVADEIRVSTSQLELIEAEDHARLPDEVYLKGTLRAYAKCIGVDEDDIIERYAINRSTFHQKSNPDANRLKARKKVFRRAAVAGAGFLAIVLVSLAAVYFLPATLSRLNPSDASIPSGKKLLRPSLKIEPGADTPKTGLKQHIGVKGLANGPLAKPKQMPGASLSASNPSAAPAAVTDGIHADKLLLSIDAVSETTINVLVDRTEYKKYHLQANDHIELEAASRFNLLISNASGVKLYLNGDPVPIHGEAGHSVNITLSDK